MNTSDPKTSTRHTPIEAPLPKIKVVGLGGGGCNAVNRMIENGMNGVDFLACNTDKQALVNSLAQTKLQLGPICTRGLGAGGRPEVGEAAAEESFQALAEAMEGAEMVFLTAGMGGGTGTGSIPVAARVAKHIGAVTIAVVTTPFSFEMGRRQKNAYFGLEKLRQFTHTLITVPNDRLLEVAPENLPLEMAFKLADDILRQGVQGIAELLTQNGLINVDFSHIRHVMELGGGARMSIGTGEGPEKVMQALNQALHHPLLDEVNLDGAAGIIANFTGGEDLTFSELADAMSRLHAEAGDQTEIIPGVINDPNLNGRVEAILIVTGLGALPIEKAIPGAERYLAEIKAIPESRISDRQPEYAGVQANRNTHSAQRGYTFTPAKSPVDSSNLDVPAFLRKRMRG